MRLTKEEKTRPYRKPKIASKQVRFVLATVSGSNPASAPESEYGPFREAPRRES